jgi:hypothetical protein
VVVGSLLVYKVERKKVFKVKKVMAKFNSFEEILSWQKARELNVAI